MAQAIRGHLFKTGSETSFHKLHTSTPSHWTCLEQGSQQTTTKISYLMPIPSVMAGKYVTQIYHSK